VSGVVLAIGALMIFTTMTGSVIERTKEIGVLRAIGFRRSHIIKGLVIEVAVISIAGGVLGWAAGMLASWAALPYFAETDITFSIQPILAVAAIAAGLLIGIAASFYPIVRASRLDPSEAVRYV
jgi:putative ABC transport system permease protein